MSIILKMCDKLYMFFCYILFIFGNNILLPVLFGSSTMSSRIDNFEGRNTVVNFLSVWDDTRPWQESEVESFVLTFISKIDTKSSAKAYTEQVLKKLLSKFKS